MNEILPVPKEKATPQIQRLHDATHETSQWELLQRQCKAFLESGFLPKHIQNLAQAITVAWKGKELGIQPLAAFSGISVINQKPCLSAELMLALIYERVKGAQVTFTTPPEKQHLECTVIMKRPDGNPQSFRFTIDDAKRAGIYKNVWEKYPAALLRARTISAGARAVFPDAIAGCYTPEEMGGEFHMDEHHEPMPSPTIPAQTKMELPSTGNPGKITQKQVARLYAIADNNGWNNEEVKEFLKDNFEIDSASDLKWVDYDGVWKFFDSNRPERQTSPSQANQTSETPH